MGTRMKPFVLIIGKPIDCDPSEKILHGYGVYHNEYTVRFVLLSQDHPSAKRWCECILVRTFLEDVLGKHRQRRSHEWGGLMSFAAKAHSIYRETIRRGLEVPQ